MELEKDKSDPRISYPMIVEAYQLMPALLMGMTPIVISAISRENSVHWKAIAEHFGYCLEWIPYEPARVCRKPDPCPFDPGEMTMIKVGV